MARRCKASPPPPPPPRPVGPLDAGEPYYAPMARCAMTAPRLADDRPRLSAQRERWAKARAGA